MSLPSAKPLGMPPNVSEAFITRHMARVREGRGGQWFTVRTIAAGCLRDLQGPLAEAVGGLRWMKGDAQVVIGIATCLRADDLELSLESAGPLACTCIRWARGVRLANGFTALTEFYGWNGSLLTLHALANYSGVPSRPPSTGESSSGSRTMVDSDEDFEGTDVRIPRAYLGNGPRPRSRSPRRG